MKGLFLIFGFLLTSTVVHAQAAKDITCSVYIAMDGANNDLKNAPALELRSTPNNVGGNNFAGLYIRGNTVYNVSVETSESPDDSEKALIKVSIAKTIDRNKIKETPVQTEGGYHTGFKVYYGTNDLLVECSDPDLASI